MIKFNNDNTSVAAYRVFETLKFLIKQPASVTDIIKHLSSLENGEKAFSKAVIYKYLTTLKFAGINIIRHKCKYDVANLPFKINFTNENLEVLQILKQILEITPETKISEKINGFFYQLNMMYSLNQITLSEETKNILNKIKTEKPNSEQLKDIKQYEKYCKDQIKLHIEYININGEKISSICEPIDVKYEDNNVWFTVFSEHPNELLELNSKQITEISQTPSKCTGLNKYLSVTTVFKLKGKLAQRYTPRNFETVMPANDLSSIIISNKEEPKDILFLRLMRYSDLCEVIKPKNDRDRMKKLIEQTLSNYNE